jgi:mannose/fructose/N-acetylgalactosamine-specific phosphotransferase system component IIC
MTPLLLRAAAWAGVISLDITAIGPFMVSQPLVAGPIFGWLMGNVLAGVIIGGIVQLVWMDVTPVGVGIPFDTTAVTVLAIYWSTLVPDVKIPHMMLALMLAAPLGYLFCLMDSYARRLNTVAVRKIERVPDSYLPLSIRLGILAGLLWSWIRYFLFYALVMGAGEALWRWLLQKPMPEWVIQGLTMSAYVFPIAGLGVALELFLTEEPERRTNVFGFKSKG